MAESPRKDRTGTRSAPLMRGEAPDESGDRLALAQEIRGLADRIASGEWWPRPFDVYWALRALLVGIDPAQDGGSPPNG